MRKQLSAMFFGIGLSLAATSASHGMSELDSLAKESIWPVTSNPGWDILYNLTMVGRSGAGVLDVALTAGNLPPGVTVTFIPTSLRFTGNQLTAQTATMKVSCTGLVPLDCYPFTITGTSKREIITITNQVNYTPSLIATRRVTLFVDNQGNGNVRVRGLGAMGGTYQIQASANLLAPSWSNVGTATADGNGRFTFFTTIATNGPAMFYRTLTLSEPMAGQY